MAGPRYRWRLIREFAAFARANRMYWLVPLVLFLVLTAVVVVVVVEVVVPVAVVPVPVVMVVVAHTEAAFGGRVASSAS